MKSRWTILLLLGLAVCGWACAAYVYWGLDNAPAEGRVAPVRRNAAGQSGNRGFEAEREEAWGDPLAYGRRHALVVGINAYKGGPFADLAGPNFDAAEVAEVLALRYGFERVTLLVDRKPKVPLPEGVDVQVVPAVSRQALAGRLQALKKDVGPRDALVFFFAGHGIRVGAKGYLVPADGLPDRVDGLLDVAEAARLLRACDAHHSLVVLDCCFSGVALEPGSGVDEAIGTLEERPLRVGGKDNLSRVFNRRAFQVITAGTGKEPVGDLARLSKEYAEMTAAWPSFQGHSPFTGTFLQALRGLTGRADGKVLVSALGYYMNDTLVNGEGGIQAQQAPKYGALGRADGDFLFIPAYRKVLNPKLLAPLYLPGGQYAELRRSACEALQQFIADQPEADRLALVRGTVTHLGRLLLDSQLPPRQTAARVLADLAAAYGKDVPELVEVRDPLVAVLKEEALKKDEKDKALRREAARALGQLARYADKTTAAAFAAYVGGLEAEWKEKQTELAVRLQIAPEEFRLPAELRDELAKFRLPAAPAAAAQPAQTLEYQDALRQRWALLLEQGLDKYVRRHEQGKTFVERAQQLLEKKEQVAARLTAAQALGFEGFGRPVGDPTFARAHPVLLFEGSPEWEAAEKVIQQASPRPLWTSPHASHHRGKVLAVAFARDGKTLASAAPDALRLWDAATGKQKAAVEISVGMFGGVPFSEDLAVMASAGPDNTLKLWDVATRQLRATLQGHGGMITAVAFSPDGKTLASSSWDKTARLWDTATGKELHKLEGHEGYVNAVAFSPDGKTVASAGVDQTVRLWDVATGRPGATLKGHQAGVFCVAFSPGGKALVSGGNAVGADDSPIRLWDLAKGESRPLKGHRKPVVSVTFSADGKTLASVSNDQSVRLWDVATGKERAALAGHGVDPFAAAFRPDGETLAVGYGDGTVRLWGVADGRPRTDFGGHGSGINAVAFAPDGKIVASAGDDRTVRVWDTAAGRLQFTVPGHGGRVLAVAFSPAGSPPLLASAGDDRTVRLWDAATGKAQGVLDGPEGSVNALAFTHDGKQLLAAIGNRDPFLGGFGEIKAWDVATRKALPRLGDGSKAIIAVAVSPGGLVAGASHTNFNVFLWDLKNLGKAAKTLAGGNEPILTVAFSPDGQTLAGGGSDKIVRLWDVKTGKPRTLEGSAGEVVGLAFSPDGKTLAAAIGPQGGRYQEKAVRLWDVATGKALAVLPGHRADIRCLAFAPDGNTLATGGDDAVWLWGVTTGPRETIKTDRGVSGRVAFSPDGKTLAWLNSGGGDSSGVQLRDQATGKVRTFGREDKAEARALGFSADGKTLAVLAVVSNESVQDGKSVAVRNETIQLWDITAGKVTRTLKEQAAGVREVAFHPDGKQLAAARGKSVVIWDLKSGKVRTTLDGHQGTVNAVAFSPDGKTLGSVAGSLGAGGPSELRLWDVATGKARVVATGNQNGTDRLAFSPDGRLLATCGHYDTEVVVWDAVTGKQRAKFEGFRGSVKDLAFSPDGKTLAAAGADEGNVIRLWDVVAGRVRSVLSGPRGTVEAVAFRPQPRGTPFTLAALTPDSGILCLWEVGAVDLAAWLRWFGFEDLDMVVQGPLSDSLLPGAKASP